MLELLFVIGFFIMLMVTGVSLLGVLAALVIKTIKAPKVPQYQRNNRRFY